MWKLLISEKLVQTLPSVSSQEKHSWWKARRTQKRCINGSLESRRDRAVFLTLSLSIHYMHSAASRAKLSVRCWRCASNQPRGSVCLPDDGGHDFSGEQNGEGGGRLGREQAHYREHGHGWLTQICRDTFISTLDFIKQNTSELIGQCLKLCIARTSRVIAFSCQGIYDMITCWNWKSLKNKFKFPDNSVQIYF